MSTDADASRPEAAAWHREMFDRDADAPDLTAERQASSSRGSWSTLRTAPRCALSTRIGRHSGRALAAGAPKPNLF